MTVSKYTSNPNLPCILSTEVWPGTPVDAKGHFVNHEFPFVPSFKDVWRWQTGPRPKKKEKRADKFVLPVQKAEQLPEGDRLIWLGHASFYLCLGGVRILIDPHFNAMPLVKRHSALPFPQEAFTDIDLVLISHDHRDHCDDKTIKLLAKQNPNMQVLTGLGLGKVIKPWLHGQDIQEAGWYQTYINLIGGTKITYLPTRHWARRTLDTNEHLWGAFMIQSAGKTVYFGGDSGYGSHYKELKTLFPKIDYALLGIGAYEPRWFMAPMHTSPEDTVQAFIDSGAKTMIPMHYGTFDLSDEPMGEPLRILNAEAHKIVGKLRILEVGEPLLP